MTGPAGLVQCHPYLLGSAPLKYALMVSVKAAATGRVSCGPIVSGLGPREQAKTKKEPQIHPYSNKTTD